MLKENHLLFKELELNQNLLRALKEAGYTKATPIQEDAIPHLMKYFTFEVSNKFDFFRALLSTVVMAAP